MDLSNRMLVDLLITAVEGGINYWCKRCQGYINGEKQTFTQLNENPDMLPKMSFVFEDDNDCFYTVAINKIQEGVQIMQEQYPKHFADIVSEDFDAETADVFVQCCIFNEVIYG